MLMKKSNDFSNMLHNFAKMLHAVTQIATNLIFPTILFVILRNILLYQSMLYPGFLTHMVTDVILTYFSLLYVKKYWS